MLSWKSRNPVGCCSMKLITTSNACRASSGVVEAGIDDVEVDGVTSRLDSAAKTCAGNGGGRIVSEGVTVLGRSSGRLPCTASSMLMSGSGGSSIGESSMVELMYFGVGASAAEVINWSTCNVGNV